MKDQRSGILLILGDDMDEKVHCQDCEHYTLLISNIATEFVCKIEGIRKDIWGQKVGVPCVVKNQDFNCKDYKKRD